MPHPLHSQCAPRLASLAVVGFAGLTFSGLALAHTGTDTHLHGMWAGWSHPFTGLDHLLAMFAVGLWAGQLGGRAIWAVPAGFVAVMMFGAAAAMTGMPVPAVEPGILLSLVALGIAIAAALRISATVGAAGVGLFALFHGAAHGIELPAGSLRLLYGAGFLAATLFIHVAGILVAEGCKRFGLAYIPRVAGSVIAVTGGLLLIY